MLGGIFRRARAQRRLSISELARRSKIGKATLSQLESGAGNPTIETAPGHPDRRRPHRCAGSRRPRCSVVRASTCGPSSGSTRLDR
ncbi:helix-turn-helix domain-containing protein [Streptomyces sp. CA-250714]|uniref:helix-turn-helix domain-containing protein n=1 Tax=Streptomyces sp. CA-250714 TaxID=3240060 RepID=UPI003D8B0D08